MVERDFIDNGFYRFSVFFWNMILGNLCFLLTNLPALMVILFAPKMNVWSFQLMLSLALIAGAPGLMALYSLMDKLIRERYIEVFKDYFKAYKQGLLDSLLLGALIVAFINILYLDIVMLRSIGFTVLNYVFIALICFLAMINIYMYPIIGRFSLRKKDILMLSVLYAMKRLPFTLLGGALLMVLGFITLNVSILAALIGFSLFAYAIMHLQQPVLNAIAEDLQEATEEQKKPTIVAFGDSLTFGHGVQQQHKWTTILEREINCILINSGINGNTSSEGLARMQEDVLLKKPDYVIINFGMNDHFLLDVGIAKVSLENFKGNIEYMVRLIREQEASPLLVVPHKVFEGDPGDEEGKGATYYYGRHNPLRYKPVGGANKQLEFYCNAVREVARELEIPLVDMYSCTEHLNPHSYLITLENSTEEDGVHINEKGARLYADKIKEELLRIIK